MRLATGSDIVDQMQELHFEGNVTPHTWYRNLTLKSGKPDLIAITLLADIAYWYRPTYIYDDVGNVRGIRKKFKADLLQRDYEAFATRFGLSKKQVREAFERLEERGLVKRHFRTIETNSGVKANNVLFVELLVNQLKEVTYSIPSFPTGNDPIALEGNSLLPQRETPSLPVGEEPIAPEGNTNTEISLEISTKNSTTTKTGLRDSDNGDGIDKLADRYVVLRGSGLYPKPSDYKAIKETLEVVPLDQAIRLLEQCFRDYRRDKGSQQRITTFAYCKPYIIDRYIEQQAREKAVRDSTNARQEFAEGSPEMILTLYLLKRIRQNNPEFKEPDVQVWAGDIHRMVTEDGRAEEKIKKAIDWCQNNTFWKAKILDAKTLRQKYDRLVMEAIAEKERQQKPKNVRKDKMPKWHQPNVAPSAAMDGSVKVGDISSSTGEEMPSFEEMLKEYKALKQKTGGC